jgi:ketosteroid isomerase-like protein
VATEALEVVQQALAAVNEGDVEAYLALCAPDVELFSPLAGLEGADVGEEGVRRPASPRTQPGGPISRSKLRS